MSAYMDLNGVPATGNRWLLTDVLRDDFGFDGFVVSDANAARSLATQHFAKDLADAGARAVHAGLDMEMAIADPAFDHLVAAVEAGQVTEAEIDQAVRRVLTAKFALGVFEHPYVDEAAAHTVLNDPATRDLAQRAAEETLVLLKNEGGLLPLDASAVRRVAIIGQLAASPRDTLGPWIFDYDITEVVTILDGVRSRLAGSAQVDFAPGAGLAERYHPSMFDTLDQTVGCTPDDHDDDAEIAAAVRLAAAADVAIVVVGQRQNQIGETASSDSLELAGRQLEQLAHIAATGTPVVALVMSGRPLDLRWIQDNVPAIVQVWYPGVRGGDAVAAAVFGDTSPAGRLPFTWPRHVGQIPVIHSHYRSFQPEESHKRYFQGPSTPLYPFGYGLSYASFEYTDLTVTPTVAVGETATVRVNVTNTSAIPADEVVQLYIHQRYGTSTRPIRELKGFQRVTLAPGATVPVEFPLGPDQLRYWSAAPRTWVQDRTTIDMWVGGDSTAELHAVLTVE
jgi:beta-glucosidase